MTEQTPNYTMILGGATLVIDGKLATAAGPAVAYCDLSFRHVQAIWRAINQPEIKAAAAAYADVVAKAMTSLGDHYGLASGRMTEAELAEIEKLFPAIPVAASKGK